MSTFDYRGFKDGDADLCREGIRQLGYFVVYSPIERAPGDVLEQSEEDVGTPIFVVGLATDDEAAAVVRVVCAAFPDALPVSPLAYRYKVQAD